MGGQTSYSINLAPVSFPGQPVDMGKKDDLSVLAVAAAIPYGRLVVRDSANIGDFSKLAGKLPAASSDITTLGKPLGVSVADQGRAQDPNVAAAQYPLNSCLPARRSGRIWVVVEEAVADGDQAFVRFQDGTVTGNNGGFRKSADTASAAALANAYYRGASISVGGLLYAVLELQLN